MKLNTKKILALLFLFMLTAETLATLVRKYQSMRKNKRVHKKFSVREDVPKTLNLSNPFFTCAVGFVESLGGDETGWYNCLPKEWTKDAPGDVSKSSTLDQQFSTLNGTLQKVLSTIGTAITYVCKAKDAVLTVVKQIMGNKDDKKSFFLEGKFRRRFRNRRGVIDWIKNTASETWNVVQSNVLSAWNTLSSPIQTAIDQAKESLLKFKQQILDLIQGTIVQKMWDIAQCIWSAGKFIKGIYDVIKSGYDKIKNISAAVAQGGVLIPLVAADLIVGLLCNWEQFKKGIDYFFLGSSKSVSGEKFYFFGKGAGTIVAAIAGAKTIAEDLEIDLKAIGKTIVRVK
jgi:hypothetical protein